MITIKEYQKENILEWNNFLQNSKSNSFLINRNYLEYHSDRFIDLSLMFYEDKNLLAILPGNVHNDTYYSHQGLTYGGFYTSFKANTTDYLNLFKVLNEYLYSKGIRKVIYKKLPYIYSIQPSDEDEYALFRLKAKLTACNISSCINMNEIYSIHRSRKSAINKASKFNFELRHNEDWQQFWTILQNNLKEKYDSKPVHKLEEIIQLHNLFPENIQLYTASLNGICEAGVVIYETLQVAHCQYISASETGKEYCALDFIFNVLLNKIFKDKKYFDFGSSTEDGGKILNQSLIFQKEGYGAKGVCYKHYEYEI